MEKCVKPSKSNIVMVVLILSLVMNRGTAAAAAEAPQSIITPNWSSPCFIFCMLMCGLEGNRPPDCVIQCRGQCRDSSLKAVADHKKISITIDQVPCTVDCIKSMYPNLAPSDVGKVEMRSIESCSQKCSKTKD